MSEVLVFGGFLGFYLSLVGLYVSMDKRGEMSKEEKHDWQVLILIFGPGGVGVLYLAYFYGLL